MDRYEDESKATRLSRENKNQELYNNAGTNQRYANIADVANINAIDITNTNKEYKTREDYQKMKKYNTDVATPKVKKDLDDFNSLYSKKEVRVYDINNVLEEARKNREEDAAEEKRKLKNNSYNILANMNKEELEKYRQEKKDRLTKDEDELRGLLDTIASKTLAGEIEAASDLLSDLMATSILEKVSKPISNEEETTPVKVIIEKEEIIMTPEEYEKQKLLDEENKEEKEENNDTKDEIDVEETTLTKNDLEDLKELQEKISERTSELDDFSKKESESEKDQDFYTRSMDLSAKDFDLDDEFKDKKIPLVVKILIFIIILVAIAATIYFISQNM